LNLSPASHASYLCCCYQHLDAAALASVPETHRLPTETYFSEDLVPLFLCARLYIHDL
jgi:hypothetical protein